MRDSATLAVQAALAVSLSVAPALAGELGGMGPAAAAKAYWARVAVECGGATYLHYGLNDTLDELKGATAHLSVDRLSQADKLNGVEWRATGWMSSTVSRLQQPDGRSWSRWEDGGTFYVHIQRSNGRLTFNGRDLIESTPAPRCDSEVLKDQPVRVASAMQAAALKEQAYMSVPFEQRARPGQRWLIAAAPVHTQPDIHSPVIGYTASGQSVPFVEWEDRKWGHIRFLDEGSSRDGFVVGNFLLSPQ